MYGICEKCTIDDANDYLNDKRIDMLSEKEFEEEIEHEDRGDALSLKERSVFDLIKKRKGIITLREIQNILGFSSSSVVHRYVKKLQKKGFISAVKGWEIVYGMD